MFKKAVIILLVVFMVVAVGGCGAKERMEEKVAESVVEGLINKAVDGEGKVDLDGDKVSIKGKDGEEFSFGAAEWPESGAAKQIPQLSQGTVVSAMNSDQFCGILPVNPGYDNPLIAGKIIVNNFSAAGFPGIIQFPQKHFGVVFYHSGNIETLCFLGPFF
jgi:hypothetical protein